MALVLFSNWRSLGIAPDLYRLPASVAQELLYLAAEFGGIPVKR